MSVIPTPVSPPSPRREEYVQTVTVKGQVTIPAEVREAIGVKTNSQVLVRIQSGKIIIEPVAMTLEESFGSVQPIARPENFKALREQALEERAEKVIRKL